MLNFYENYRLLGYEAAYFYRSSQTFRRNIDELPPNYTASHPRK
jgi:hypothetical protein